MTETDYDCTMLRLQTDMLQIQLRILISTAKIALAGSVAGDEAAFAAQIADVHAALRQVDVSQELLRRMRAAAGTSATAVPSNDSKTA